MPTPADPTVLAAKNFLLPDATFIAEVVAFLLILAFMWKYVVPPLQRSMNERQALIRKQFDDSREAKERLAAAEAEYKSALAQTRADSARITEEARQQGQRIIEEMRTKAQHEADRINEREEGRLEAMRQQVLGELRAEVGALAVELASRIVGESLADEARQHRVVERFLAELDEDGGADAEKPPAQPDGSPAERADARS